MTSFKNLGPGNKLSFEKNKDSTSPGGDSRETGKNEHKNSAGRTSSSVSQDARDEQHGTVDQVEQRITIHTELDSNSPKRRSPADVFDYAHGNGRAVKAEKPGYVHAVLRGTSYEPVFGKKDNWFTNSMSGFGNWILQQLANESDGLIHSTHTASTRIPFTEDIALGFSASGRKIPERELSSGDPRRIGLEQLKTDYPGAIPLWTQGKLGQNLSFDFGHNIPIGGGAGMIRFGFDAGQELEFSMERLLFAATDRQSLVAAAQQLKRLRLNPLSGDDMSQMEIGASFSLTGEASLRLDAGLGFGTSIKALDDAVEIGANVEAGAYAALSGDFEVELKRLPRGQSSMTIMTGKNAQSGVQLKALAGVDLNRDKVSKFFRSFVDYVLDGGEPEAFDKQLSNEYERELANSAGDYARLLAKNISEGVAASALDSIVDQYTSAFLKIHAGVEIDKRFKTTVVFDLESDDWVVLPRADMVPDFMRGGVKDDRPLRVPVAKVSRLAYSLATKGDMRLVQQLALVRNSGVRINEQRTTETRSNESGVEFRLPFLEYRNLERTSSRVENVYTPELGRMRTVIEAFNKEYRGIFGDRENSSAHLRVHSPEGALENGVFFGSTENFSADFVVANHVENWTDFEEMQDYMGILNSLSGGRLESRAREVLASGQYRDDDSGDLMNPIHQLFFKPREFGKSVVHLHVWLGESGLRKLLDSSLSQDDMYAMIGGVFADLEPSGGSVQPAWAQPGADRSLYRGGRRFEINGGLARDYDIAPMGHDLKSARFLVDNLMRLRELAATSQSPAAEENLAKEMRNFLRDAQDKLPAFAALASMVPEEDRAVEMRLSSVRDGATPIRFTYIQDGRSAELLYAAGYARMAMQQFKRFQSHLDPETRMRIGNLLGSLHEALNQPSPDPYVLKVVMNKLDSEMERLDNVAVFVDSIIESDIDQARLILDALPDTDTIQRTLPNAEGIELARLRLNAMRLLNEPQPDLALLRATFVNIFEKMPQYREILAIAPVLENTARLANEMAEQNPKLVEEAVQAVASYRSAVVGNANQSGGALEGVLRVNQELMGQAEQLSQNRSQVEALSEETLRQARESSGNQSRFLVGSSNKAAISYFERSGLVPKSFMGISTENRGPGIVTASMINEAELAMAMSRPSGNLNIPSLTKQSVDLALSHAKRDDVGGFLNVLDRLRYRNEPIVEPPKKAVLRAFLEEIPKNKREDVLKYFSKVNAGLIEGIFDELDSEETHTEHEHHHLGHGGQSLSPEYQEDLRFFNYLLQSEPKKLESSLVALGYSVAITKWSQGGISRLDAIIKQMTGDELNALVREMNSKQKTKFLRHLRHSDLSPFTRAKIAGQIVDNDFFWKQEEDLVAAVTQGMNAGDTRLFFDQLYTDGKLEDFLSAGSFWQTLLNIFTFGIAALFTHNNKAAMRVVAASGWSSEELQAQYDTNLHLHHRLEKSAESILFHSTIHTIPMDPAVRGSLKVVHTLIGDVKYYDFADLPDEAGKLLTEIAKGAGKQLARRLGDIAKQGGSTSEVIAEYRKFFEGLSPEAISDQLKSADTDGTVSVIAKALADGAVAGLIHMAQDPNNKFVTLELLKDIVQASNLMDSSVRVSEDSQDPRLDDATREGLVKKWEFFKQYTGFDYSQIEILYGGLAVAAPAVAFGNMVSVSKDSVPLVDGKMVMTESFQKVVAFHETAHLLQQVMYGAQLNAFIDQGFHIHGGGSRNGAYTVTQQMFDDADSIHDFRQHWEQQAELIEMSMRMLWDRSEELGQTNLAMVESYPGAGRTLRVAGGTIELTPERWKKMVRFVREFGNSSQNGLRQTGGRFEYTPVRADPT